MFTYLWKTPRKTRGKLKRDRKPIGQSGCDWKILIFFSENSLCVIFPTGNTYLVVRERARERARERLWYQMVSIFSVGSQLEPLGVSHASKSNRYTSWGIRRGALCMCANFITKFKKTGTIWNRWRICCERI